MAASAAATTAKNFIVNVEWWIGCGLTESVDMKIVDKNEKVKECGLLVVSLW